MLIYVGGSLSTSNSLILEHLVGIERLKHIILGNLVISPLKSFNNDRFIY